MNRNDDFYNLAFYFTIFLIIFTIYFSIASAQNLGAEYYFGLLFVPLLVILAIFLKRTSSEIRILNQIKGGWGKKNKRKRNFNSISEFHKQVSKSDNTKFYIDDQTWQDLNMDEVYGVIDRTLSKPGEQVLYNLLRTPSFYETEIKKRSAIINLFRENNQLRQKMQILLFKLGREKHNGVISLLWMEEPTLIKGGIIFYIMSILSIVSIFSIIPFGIIGGCVMILVMFICNFAIHGLVKKNISGDLPSIGKIGDLIRTAKAIKDIEAPLIEEQLDDLNKLAQVCGFMAKKTIGLGRTEGIDIMADYFNILFLREEISYFSVIKGIKKYREELRRMYIIIGELDSYISIASYREEIVDFVEPEFTYEGSNIEILDGRHPLIEEAIPNSIMLQRGGIILTGSNMSGKSTFLRMLGVNALLAQTIATCLAKTYKASLLMVLTSISPSDNIMGGKSYYLGEAEALLRIIKTTEDNVPSLCMIDEIFRGTNPIERVSAAAEILDYLPNHNAMTIAATHDIELTEMVKNHYECYYFTEDVGEEGLIFDYKLRKGISNTRNAIKVLKFMGYPDEIIEGANLRIK